MVVEYRPCGVISTLFIYDNVDVAFNHHLQQTIQISAPDFLIEKIETTEDGSILTIRNNNKFNWLHDLDPSLTVWVNPDSLQYLAFYGTGKVYTETAIKTSDFKITIGKSSNKSNGIVDLEVFATKIDVIQNEGFSDITIRGVTQQLYLYNYAFGPMKLSDMQAQDVYVECQGSNNTFVRSENSLRGSLSYVGDLYYFGNPNSVNVSVSGKGQLIHVP